MTAWIALVGLLGVVAACTSDGESPAGGAGAAGGDTTAGGARPGTGGAPGAGGAAQGGRSEPSGGSAGAERAADAQSEPGPDDAGSPPPPPAARAPAPACGDDLQIQVGTATPDFGAPAAGPAVTTDPASTGPFGVLRVAVTIPNPDPTRPSMDATFYAPSADGGATAAPGPMPLVLVMHGFGTTHTFYEHFSTHLASHGLITLGLTLPPALVAAHDKNAAEAIAAIDVALSTAPAAVAGRADPDRIAVAGHSFGGKIGFYAAAIDPRVDLVIGYDPSNAGGPPCFVDPNACNAFVVAPNCLAQDPGIVHRLEAESLIFRAAPDGANPEVAHNADQFFRGAPGPATLVDYGANAAHGDWANPLAAVVEHTKRVQLALLLTRFFGASGLEDYLPDGPQVAAGPGVVRVLRK